MPDLRAVRRETGMSDEGDEPEHHHVQDHIEQDWRSRLHHRRPSSEEGACHSQPNGGCWNRSCRSAERDDECAQVDRQRHHPQQGDRRDVGAHVGRDGQHHAEGRKASSVQRPTRRQPRPPVVRGSCWHCLNWSARRRSAGDKAARRRQDDEERESPRPPGSLLVQTQQWLDQERIGEQTAEAAQVASREKEVWIVSARPSAPRVPTLEQRPGCRDDEKRQPDHDREDPEQPQDRGRVHEWGRVGGQRDR